MIYAVAANEIHKILRKYARKSVCKTGNQKVLFFSPGTLSPTLITNWCAVYENILQTSQKSASHDHDAVFQFPLHWCPKKYHFLNKIWLTYVLRILISCWNSISDTAFVTTMKTKTKNIFYLIFQAWNSSVFHHPKGSIVTLLNQNYKEKCRYLKIICVPLSHSWKTELEPTFSLKITCTRTAFDVCENVLPKKLKKIWTTLGTMMTTENFCDASWISLWCSWMNV